MANELTGDYDAVLQVTEKTINRLMATLHQNAVKKDNRLRQPHMATLRIDKTDSPDGLCGWVVAQIGVTELRLIHRATDRVKIRVNVRAQFFADPDSTYLPPYINGVVRATYEVKPIDQCLGWKTKAKDFIWARVLPDTVEFTGTANDDRPVPFGAADAHGRIERLLARLLERRFEAPPQYVGKEFRRTEVRCLDIDGEAVVAVPILPAGHDPARSVSSVDHVFTARNHFAVGISRDVLLAEAERQIARLRERQDIPPIYIKTEALGLFTVYSDVLFLEWYAVGTEVGWDASGAIIIDVEGRVVDTQDDDEVVLKFTMNTRINVGFDPVTESLVFIHAGDPKVRPYDLPWLADLFVDAEDYRDDIQRTVNKRLSKLPSIPVGQHKEPFAHMLQRLDQTADVRFVGATFSEGGIALLGRVAVTKRKPPVVDFTKGADDQSLTAFASWAPGGWIDRFVWKWVSESGQQETLAIHDRFLAQRPWEGLTRWGKGIPQRGVPPIPGIDRYGRICLSIEGFQLDPVSGLRAEFSVPFWAEKCKEFHHPLAVMVDGRDRLLQKVPSPNGAAAVMIDLGGAAVDPKASNTLIVYAGGQFDAETATALAHGLEASTREDAGLAIFVLLEEGRNERGIAVALSERTGAHVVVIEDVGRAWTRRFGIAADGNAWRLINPKGALRWSHDGLLSPERLGQALDDYLRTSPPVSFRPIDATVTIMGEAPPISLRKRDFNCPNPPSFASLVNTGIVFALPNSPSSDQQLTSVARIVDRNASKAMNFIVVLDGDERDAAELSRRFPDLEIIADPDAEIADSYGIRAWPTTIGIDDEGRVNVARSGILEFPDLATAATRRHASGGSDSAEGSAS
ncbi:hypothetical protein A5662_18960 [Mycobacteriaceae bacterium 1482268.1]|nr:hypothetical protein A5662_18960 [Mycobacteriaceae bacterium 1482268.1]